MRNLTLAVTHPSHVMMSSDFSQQEPKLTCFVTQDRVLLDAFTHGRDAYATLASIALGYPYEECLEFHPETGEMQPEGKERRSIGKVLNLGITYGMSVPSIRDSLFGTRDDMTDSEKDKQAQKIYDAMMKGFPGVANGIAKAQQRAAQLGYTETILGRRRHHPNMQLPRFEFVPMPGYVNPDIDPLDPKSLENKEQIPKRIVEALKKEFASYKWYSKIVKRTKELAEEKIKVVNNSYKIEEASRQVFNCVTKDTEILTTAGWRKHNEVKVGDPILSFSIDRQCIEEDTVLAIHDYDEPTDVIDFENPTFSASSTADHRWVVYDSKHPAEFQPTSTINGDKWTDYPILRVWDNSLPDAIISDDELKLIGWLATDASADIDAITLYQSTSKDNNAAVYADMISTLDKLGLEYADHTNESTSCSHHIYLRRCDKVHSLSSRFQGGLLPYDFIASLSQRQSEIVLRSMLQGDGEGVDGQGYPIGESNIAITCSSIEKADRLQYLAFKAGYATNCYEITAEDHNSNPSSSKVYDSVSNSKPIQINKSYYKVSILRVKRAHIYPHHKSTHVAEDGVWCVTTNNNSWVARRNGKVYITGNSIVQGSAADLTKMAMLNLEHDEEWKSIGGKFVLPVHDELICEVPAEFAQEGAKILARCMSEAGNFLPFPLDCDVETTFRWYGLPYNEVMSRDKPDSLDWKDLSDSEVEWVQCMLIENEYQLPVFKEPGGGKPTGVRALGVNAAVTEELEAAVEHYKKKYGLETDSEFIEHIEKKVVYGVY